MSKKNKKNKKVAKKHSKENHHKHLNELGIKSTESCIFNTREDTNPGQKQFKKERKEHSFDMRETWSLDYTLATWLYEHLMVFKEIDKKARTKNKIEINTLVMTKKGSFDYQTETMTEQQAIELACEYLGEYLTISFVDSNRFEYEKAALGIVSELLPILWW